MAKKRWRPFFSPQGLAIFVIALLVLIRSLYARNVYEIVLSSGALFFLLILGLSGAWALRLLKNLEPHWKPPFPLAAGSAAGFAPAGAFAPAGSAADEWLVNCPLINRGRLPFFFRLHFLVRGRFYPQGMKGEDSLSRRFLFGLFPGGKSGVMVFAQSSLPRGKDTAPLDLVFPMGGLFVGEGHLRLRDIFGIFSFPCGVDSQQTLNIRSAPCDKKPLRIEALSGEEDKIGRAHV